MADVNTPIRRLYNKGYHVGMRLFDVDGNEYEILGSRMLSGFVARIFRPRVRVEVDLGMIGQRSIDVIQSALTGAIEKQSDFWDEGEDPVLLMKRVVSFTSTRDMIRTLSEEYFKEFG